MDVAIRFVEALDAGAAGADPDLLPERLAHAAAAVLPVDGVGLSLHGEAGRQTPLAASSEVAALAERLQFTAGSGPCLLATEYGLPCSPTRRSWPFGGRPSRSAGHEDAAAQRAGAVLAGQLRAVGAMDPYFADPDGVTAVDVYEARCVGQLVSDHLDVAAHWSVWTPTELPAWSNTPDAQRRRRLLAGACVLLLGLAVGGVLPMMQGTLAR